MGQPLSQFLGKYEGTKKYAASAEKAELIIGTVSQVYGYYTLGEKLGLWGGGLSELDALRDALRQLEEAINKAFAELKMELHSEFRLQTDQNIETVLGTARTAVDTLAGHWSDADEWDKKDVFFGTLYSMNVLIQDAWWLRTFYKEAAYEDAWTGLAVPPDLATSNGSIPKPGSYQFDYLLALPAFLEALSCRLVVLRLLDPEDIPTAHRPELLRYVTMLREKYEKIAGGIQILLKPTRDEVMFKESPVVFQPSPVGLAGTINLGRSRWEVSLQGTAGMGGPYGAYDVWSTVSSVESYPTQPPRPWWPGALPDELYAKWRGSEDQVAKLRTAVEAWYDEEIEPRHGLRSLRHWKQVHGSLSLRRVWNIRNDLLALLGQRPEAPPGPTDLWSLRDAVDVIPEDIRPSYSLRGITDLCKTDHSLAALARV